MPKITLQTPLDQPTGKGRFLALIRETLNNDAYDSFKLIVAFAKQGPLRKLRNELQAWKNQGKSLQAVIGLDENGTSKEALELALELFDAVFVVHGKSSMNATFHPKMYLFEGTEDARLFCGSNNLTVGGSEINAEAYICLDLRPSEDHALISQVKSGWNDSLAIARRLDQELLADLVDSGMVLSEQALRNVKIKTMVALADADRKPDTQQPEFKKLRAIRASAYEIAANQPAIQNSDWQAYGAFLEKCSKVNLFWSVGKKNNRLSTHLWAIDFWIKNYNDFETNDERSVALKEASAIKFPDQTMEGIRALFFSRLIGLVTSTYPSLETSEAYKALRLADPEGALNDHNLTIFTNQLEKFYFWNDFFSVTNRHLGEGGQTQTHNAFHIYPVIFLYQVILRLYDNGYDSCSLTKFEIENFLVLARDHGEVDTVASLVDTFRQALDQDEIEAFLKNKSQDMDTRFYAILQYCKYLSFSQELVALKPIHLKEIQEKVKAFNELYASGDLIRFEEAGSQAYRDMLFANSDIIGYHNSAR